MFNVLNDRLNQVIPNANIAAVTIFKTLMLVLGFTVNLFISYYELLSDYDSDYNYDHNSNENNGYYSNYCSSDYSHSCYR